MHSKKIIKEYLISINSYKYNESSVRIKSLEINRRYSDRYFLTYHVNGIGGLAVNIKIENIIQFIRNKNINKVINE